MFHTECYERMLVDHRRGPLLRGPLPDCPNCRGVGRIIATWRFIEPISLATPVLAAAAAPTSPEPSVATPEPARTPDTDDFSTPLVRPAHAPAFPWWPTEFTYHSGTGLGDDRFGLLVDPGSWGNLQGEKWLQRAASLALQHGKKPRQERRKKPMTVGGVGHGTQSCAWDCMLPIAPCRADGSYCEATFEAPTIEGSECPALWGLRSLIEHRAILDCAGRVLHLQGPTGEAEITLPPGSESYQLEQSPSGHLLLPVSDYKNLANSIARHGAPTVPPRHLLATYPDVAVQTEPVLPQDSSSSRDHLVAPASTDRSFVGGSTSAAAVTPGSPLHEGAAARPLHEGAAARTGGPADTSSGAPPS